MTDTLLRNLDRPVYCYIKDLCNRIEKLQYEILRLQSSVNRNGIGTPSKPVNDIYTKNLKVGENSIVMNGTSILFEDVGTKITATSIGTQSTPFETIYAKKIDVDNEVDNFTVDGFLIVKGETTLGTDTTTDTTVKGNLTVEGTSSLEGTVTLGTDITTDTTVKGNLTVEGNQTIFTSELNPTDPSDPNDYDNSAVIVKGGVNIEQDLFVDGTIYGTVEGDIIPSGNIIIEGTLKVEQETTLDKTLNVEDKTTLKGGVDLGTTSSITDAVDIDGTGDLTMGTITMTGFTVDADGDVTLGDPSNSSDLIVYGTLDVTGDVTIGNPIVAEDITVDSVTGNETWSIRTPIICSFNKLLTNSFPTIITLPKSVGNFDSLDLNDVNVYSLVISRTNGNFELSDNPYYFGYIQISNETTGKVLLTQSSVENQISSISATKTVFNRIDLEITLDTSGSVECTISLTQLR